MTRPQNLIYAANINWEDVDYTGFLPQSIYWPSTGKQQVITIDSMAPQHAISAFHTLLRWDNVGAIKYSTLARALIERAVGEPMLYDHDPVLTPAAPEKPSLEDCYDMLDTLKSWEHEMGRVHPIAKARMLQDMIIHNSTDKEQ